MDIGLFAILCSSVLKFTLLALVIWTNLVKKNNIMNKAILILLTLWIFLSSNGCPSEPIEPNEIDCIYEMERLFNFGFEGVTLTQDNNKAYFSGIDQAYTSHNNWDDWQDHLSIGYEDGNANQRMASIVSDPLDPNNSVLKNSISSPHIPSNNPKKGRIQLNTYEIGCLKEYYQKTKVFFPAENMEHLKTYPYDINWLSIFEFWNNKNWGSNVSNPFRVTVGLSHATDENDFFFKVKADKSLPFNNFEVLWEERNLNYPIPLCKWIEIELYILEGNQEEGRFYLAIIEDGIKTVIFDINNYTVHPNEDSPDGYQHLQSLKWYTSDNIINHMKDGGYTLDVYWDDLEVFKNKQP